jgi:putative PIN family toxin of toxin-antitoxin system
MFRLVLDTDVVVAAISSPSGASRALLRRILRRELEIALSTSLFVEYEAVLLRPDRLAHAGATTSEIATVLDALAAVAIPVAFDFRWRPTGANVDDELVLETAVNGQANAIATFNLRHLRHAATRFGIVADRPGPILRSLTP